MELLWLKDEYKSLLSGVQLMKCLKARLWEDSRYVSKQLDGIGIWQHHSLKMIVIYKFLKNRAICSYINRKQYRRHSSKNSLSSSINWTHNCKILQCCRQWVQIIIVEKVQLFDYTLRTTFVIRSLMCTILKQTPRMWSGVIIYNTDFHLIAHYFSFKGPALSNALVNAGITTFQKISDTNPRELELVWEIKPR